MFFFEKSLPKVTVFIENSLYLHRFQKQMDP